MNFKFFLFVILIVGISFSRIKTDDVEALDSIKGVTGTFSGRITGSDVEVSDSIKGVTGTFSGALTGATLNTGNGANELYAMDQNVRSTDSINALTNKATRGHFDSLQLGSGSYLKTYVEGTMPCTLKTSDVTVQQIGTAYYTKVGNVLTMSFPSLTGTSSSSGLTLYFTIPYLPKQQLSGYGFNKTSITVTDNGATVNATAQLTGNPALTNRLSVNIIPYASFTSSGTKGFAPFSISYITE